jgi:hypothetical protein
MPASQPALATPPAETPRAFAPAGHALLRFNNLPYRDLASSLAADLRARLARLAELDAWLRDRAPAICARLHETIARRAGERAAHPLIALKRDVYAGRATRVPLETAAALCDDGDLRAWYAATAEIDALRRAVDDALPRALAEERALLREILSHPDFRRAAMVSSLSLDAAISGYAERPLDEHGKRQRKSEQGLLSYALRAMTRTSPYSYYTSVGFAGFAAGGAITVTPPATRVRLVEAHHAVVRRLVAAAIALPEVKAHVLHRACESRRVVDGHLVYEILRDDPVAHPRVFASRQLQGRFPASRPILALLDWLTARGPQSCEAIAGALAAALPGADPAAARAVVERLAAAGVIVPEVPIRDGSDDILAEASAFLGSLPAEASRRAAAALDGMAAALRSLPIDDLAARRAAVVAVERAWEDASAAVGRDPGGAPRFYEDTALPEAVTLDAAAWTRPLEDLAEVAALVETFDNNDILQAVFRDVFVARHGRGGACGFDEFLPAVPSVFDRWFRLATTGLPAELRDRHPHLVVKKELRRRVKAALRARLGDGEEIEVPRPLLDEIAGTLAASRPRAHTAYGIFLQPEIVDGTVARVVVNHAYNGLGQFFSRFLRLFDEAAADSVRRHIRGLFPEDRVIAGLRPVMGFNANLHPPLAAVDCAVGPARPGELRPEELVLTHDVDRDAVILTRGPGGPQVTVLYSGFLIPFLLPSRYSLLASLEGPGQSHMHLLDVEHSPRGRITHYPRVRFGRVVLARRAWYVPAELFPRALPGEPDAAHYTRLNVWRLERGIPAQLFVKRARTVSDRAFENPADFFNELDHQREKPQFVDLESALLHRFLVKWLEEAPGKDLILEEVAPAPSRALCRGAAGPQVTEVLVEVDRSPWREGGAA